MTILPHNGRPPDPKLETVWVLYVEGDRDSDEGLRVFSDQSGALAYWDILTARVAVSGEPVLEELPLNPDPPLERICESCKHSLFRHRIDEDRSRTVHVTNPTPHPNSLAHPSMKRCWVPDCTCCEDILPPCSIVGTLKLREGAETGLSWRAPSPPGGEE